MVPFRPSTTLSPQNTLHLNESHADYSKTTNIGNHHKGPNQAKSKHCLLSCNGRGRGFASFGACWTRNKSFDPCLCCHMALPQTYRCFQSFFRFFYYYSTTFSFLPQLGLCFVLLTLYHIIVVNINSLTFFFLALRAEQREDVKARMTSLSWIPSSPQAPLAIAFCEDTIRGSLSRSRHPFNHGYTILSPPKYPASPWCHPFSSSSGL